MLYCAGGARDHDCVCSGWSASSAARNGAASPTTGGLEDDSRNQHRAQGNNLNESEAVPFRFPRPERYEYDSAKEQRKGIEQKPY